MPKKFLLCADVHWSQYSSIIRKRGEKYSVRLENLVKSMNWVEQLALKEKCDGVIIAGDFFDKPALNAEEITALQDVELSGITHHFLVGNHESNISTLEYSTTSIFKQSNSLIYNEITKVSINDKVDFYFIPYLMSEKIPKLDSIVDKNKVNVVIAHQEIAGLQYGKFLSQSGFDVEDILKNCSLFLDGHLHNGAVIKDRIIVLGNLTGQNFNEDATKYEHLAYILTVEDDGSLSLEAFENPHAFNFYHIGVENKQDLNQLLKLKQNAVISVVCDSSLSEDVDKLLMNNQNIVEHRKTVTHNYISIDNSESSEFKVYDHFKQFIDYAQQKFEISPALIDELARLGGHS